MSKIIKEILYFIAVFAFFGLLVHKETIFHRIGLILQDPSIFFHFWHLLGSLGGYLLFIIIRLVINPMVKKLKKDQG